MVGNCPRCNHANMPFHTLNEDIMMMDKVTCSFEDCNCIRHLTMTENINNLVAVSANMVRG